MAFARPTHVVHRATSRHGAMETPSATPSEVAVHPLVLLSVVDHFGRCDEVRARTRDDRATDGRSGWMIDFRT